MDVNRMRFPLLCEKSGDILLVLVGLTADRQLDEILVDLESLKIHHSVIFTKV